VIATDGNAIPVPRECPVLQLAPGERIDATVTMNRAGVWILGETDDQQRSAGAGVVIEYAGAKGPPVWRPPVGEWDLAALAAPGAPPDGEIHRIELVIEPGVNGNLWAINGRSFPDTDPILLRGNMRNRLALVNRAMMDHPVHTHRHSFEITKYVGRPIRGLRKDVVVVPAHQSVEVDIEAPNPGLSLFHCHQQFHMDFGFMALMQCSS
jgi:FtsP/CotA-like multicopper oxidase with cupredoxin domain